MAAPLGLRSLAAMAHVLTQALDVDEVVETAAEHARAALGAATVSISRIEVDHDRIRTIINVGDLTSHERRWPDDETYPITGDERLMSAMHERRSWVDSIDDPECHEGERALLNRLDKGCSLVVAIVIDGIAWGEFYATRHVGDDVFDAEALAYGEVLVAILGAALASALRAADLEELAYHDPLTGLLNRRALDERAADLFAREIDDVHPVAVVAVDIDGLKRVNDTEGHARGDQVIRGVAAALLHAFNPLTSSVVARVGGDEFTVLVSGDDVELAESTINWVCGEVAGRSRLVELSAGIAYGEVSRRSPATAGALFAAADQAQYVAKRGRSSVAVVADGLHA